MSNNKIIAHVMSSKIYKKQQLNSTYASNKKLGMKYYYSLIITQNDDLQPEEIKEEREIIFSLDSYVVLEYIKSSVDIILNLKFEEIEKRLIDKNTVGSIKSNNNESKKGSSMSHQEGFPSGRSLQSNQEGPPKIYEEVIQNLEADIRKHIRVRSYKF